MANEQNLTPFPPGTSGNPAGRPKGSKNLSTIIRDLLEQEPDWSKVNIKDIESLKARYKNASAGEALTYVAFTKALAGDVRAMRWLSKTGYGDKITFDGDMRTTGMVIYKPEKYPRIHEHKPPTESSPNVNKIPPSVDKPQSNVNKTFNELDGIA